MKKIEASIKLKNDSRILIIVYKNIILVLKFASISHIGTNKEAKTQRTKPLRPHLD
jgi:hypothetical protein